MSPQQRMVAEVVKAGGRVIAGTDSPIFPYGLSLLMEVEHYAMGGLTPSGRDSHGDDGSGRGDGRGGRSRER